METDNIRELDDDELAALKRFAACYGRNWKNQLASVYWYNSRLWRGTGYQENDGAILHGLRNDPKWSHAGLNDIKIPKEINS